jgi:prepilin-type processing-associated H-X9-DG protein
MVLGGSDKCGPPQRRGNLSFADGHVEHWKWAVPKVFRSRGQTVEPQEEWRDYNRIRNHIRKTMD